MNVRDIAGKSAHKALYCIIIQFFFAADRFSVYELMRTRKRVVCVFEVRLKKKKSLT